MKYLAVLIFGIFIGLVIGLNAPNSILEDASKSVPSTTPLIFPTETTALTSNVHLKAIKDNQIDTVINALLYSELPASETENIQSHLTKHLIQLSNDKQWHTLDAWLIELNATSLVNALYYQLQAQSYAAKGQFLTALETLFSANALAQTEQEQSKINREIHSLINFVSEEFFSGSHLISKQVIESFLQFAKQQELEYIPTSLALAQLYRQSNQLKQAQDELNNLPYDEQHTSAVEDLQRILATELAQDTRNQQGIPLIKHGSQFWVSVNIGNEMDLQLLIDTGASYTSLSMDAISRLMNQTNAISSNQRQLRVNTANGSTTARVFTLSSLAIDYASLNDIPVLEVNMGENSQTDGLLGMNFLGQFRFEIDQEKNLLFLEPKG